MRLFALGRPRPARPEEYDRVITGLGDALKARKELVALYQVGNVTTPGISDIDLLAVFEDGAACRADPLRDVPPPDRYFFTHELHGLSRTHFDRLRPYAFFVPRLLLWGKELDGGDDGIDGQDNAELKAQIALEYLVRIYIGLAVERSYGVIKVRSLLLHARAMLLDLELLNHAFGNLYEELRAVVRLRDTWFAEKRDRKEFPGRADSLFAELTAFLKSAFRTHALFIPAGGNLSVAPNMRIEPAEGFSFRRRGLILPRGLRRLGPKYVNLQNRFNHFVFQLPVESRVIPDPILRRHRLLKEIYEYNRANLPAFSPFACGLPLFAKTGPGRGGVR